MKFVLTVPAGPVFEPRMAQTLRSIAAQGIQVGVALCDVSDDPRAHDLAAEFTHLVAYRRHGADKGQSDAINEGWRAVDGDIYGWLNCDDALTPAALGRVADIFKTSPDVDVVYGQSLILDDQGAVIGAHPAVRAPSERLYYDDIISQPSCFIRRKALFDLGLVQEDLHYTMDWDLWVRLMESGARFQYLPEVLSSVIWATDTKTGQLSVRRYQELWALLSRNCPVSRRIKSMIGFTQHHFSAYRDNAISSASWDFFRTDGKLRLPIFHYEADKITALRLEGLADIKQVSLDGVLHTVSDNGQIKLAAPLAPATIGLLELEGQPENLRIELLTDQSG